MLNAADDLFAATLPAGVVRPAADGDRDEPRGRFAGSGGWVAAPRSVDEVAAVVRACAAARVGIVPRGGGTGLVGGQVWPGSGPAPLILSLARMARLRSVHPDENAVIVEAGMTLHAVRQVAAGVGRQFPLSIASQGSAQIGGILAANAGGTAVLRHGNARALCLGVEAVLADGTVVRDLRRLRKDNSGYAIRDLLIGSEGTLGIITAASLALAPVPPGRAVAFVPVADPAAALALLARVQGRMAGCVTAFELIGAQGWHFLAAVFPGRRQPFAVPPEWCVLVELGLPAGLDPAEALADALDGAEAILARSNAEAEAFWALREAIPDANRRIGAVASHDISLPLSEMAGFIADTDAWAAAQGDLRVNCFGHLGDGNLHYNLFPAPGRVRAQYEARRAGLSDHIHATVLARGGSIAAEHGVGRLKAAVLAATGDPGRLAAMRAVKAALDPAGILNPGAVLIG